MPTKTKDSVTFGDRMKIGIFIKDKIKVVNEEERTVTYIGEWNDRLVAEHASQLVGKPITHNTVRYIRQEVYGRLPVGGMPNSHAGAKGSRIAQLEAQVADLQTRLEALEGALGIGVE